MRLPTRTEAFNAVVDVAAKSRNAGRRWKYAPELAKLRTVAASGVYAIIERRIGQVLYVGESHTDRLYDTITRHFREWRVDPRQDDAGRRIGGHMYERWNVKIAYMLTPAAAAQDAQYLEIQRLKPRDNFVDGATVCCDDTPPF